MKWRKWIKQYGEAEIAYKLRVHQNTVRNWVVDGGVPKDILKKDLVRLAKGAIAYEDFFK